jgi:hypothetical protein
MKKTSLIIAVVIASSTLAISASNSTVDAKKVVISQSVEQSVEASKEISRRRRR